MSIPDFRDLPICGMSVSQMPKVKKHQQNIGKIHSLGASARQGFTVYRPKKADQLFQKKDWR